jgi:hypothetical protein
VCEQDGVLNATPIGRAMLFSPGILQGLSTLNLTRDEIVLFELSLQNTLALIKIPAALQRLKCTGSMLDKVSLKLLLDSWCEKGWAIQRSNHMYYFTFAARVVAGVTAVTKRSGPPLLSMVGKENLSFVTEQFVFSGIEEDKNNVKIKKQKTVRSVKKGQSSPLSPPEKLAPILPDDTMPLASGLETELSPTLPDETIPLASALEKKLSPTLPDETALSESELEAESSPILSDENAPLEIVSEAGTESETLIEVACENDMTSPSTTDTDPLIEPVETSREDGSTISSLVEADDTEDELVVAVSEHAPHASLDFLNQALKDIDKTKSRMNNHQLPLLIDLDKKVLFLQHVRDVFFQGSSVPANRMLTMIIGDLLELKEFSGDD